MSLFDRLGGAPAITAAAELFYRQVLADPFWPVFRRWRVSLELARLGDPAIVRAYLCGGLRSVARMPPEFQSYGQGDDARREAERGAFSRGSMSSDGPRGGWSAPRGGGRGRR